jgi:ATP-dependent exoDNAse (exonuclease V) alpha subunit
VLDLDANGRQRAVYTTAASVEQEQRLEARVKELASDKSQALRPEQIEAAAERFLAANPHVDRNAPQWTAQRQMAQDIGTGGQLTLSLGVHGAGKTKAVVGVLTDAWHEQGMSVIGVTAPWKASGELKSAGLDQTMALAALLHRYDAGKVSIDSRTVLVLDEASLVGMKDQDRLTDIVAQTGARLVEIGDTRQIQAVENPALDLVARAIGDDRISKIMTTVRQRDDHDKAVALMWRAGRADEAIAALESDGRFHLVAGGPDATIRHTVKVWRDLVDAGSETPLVVTPNNRAARHIGMAIRADRQQRGEIGPDITTVKARDKNTRRNV